MFGIEVVVFRCKVQVVMGIVIEEQQGVVWLSQHGAGVTAPEHGMHERSRRISEGWQIEALPRAKTKVSFCCTNFGRIADEIEPGPGSRVHRGMPSIPIIVKNAA